MTDDQDVLQLSKSSTSNTSSTTSNASISSSSFTTSMDSLDRTFRVSDLMDTMKKPEESPLSSQKPKGNTESKGQPELKDTSKKSSDSSTYKTSLYGIVQVMDHPLKTWTSSIPNFWHAPQDFVCAYDGYPYHGIPVIVDMIRKATPEIGGMLARASYMDERTKKADVLGVAVCCSLSCKEAMKQNLFPFIVPHVAKTNSALINWECYGVKTTVAVPPARTRLDRYCTDNSIRMSIGDYRKRLTYPAHGPPNTKTLDVIHWKVVVDHCPFPSTLSGTESFAPPSRATVDDDEQSKTAEIATNKSSNVPLHRYFKSTNDVENRNTELKTPEES